MARKSSRPSRTTGQASDKQTVVPAEIQPTTSASDQTTGANANQPTPTVDCQPTISSDAQSVDSPIKQATDASSTQTTPGSESQSANDREADGLAGRAESVAEPNTATGNLPAGSVKARCADRGHRREKAPHTPAAKRKGVPLTPLEEQILHVPQPATCNLQTCNLQPATCNLQLATCNLQLAT